MSKNTFSSVLWIHLSFEKKSLGDKYISRQMQRICMLYAKKTLENRPKSTFFLRASEKRVIYVLFKNHTVCELKVCRSLPKNSFGLIEHFLTILLQSLGGRTPCPPPFSLNTDFTRSVAKRDDARLKSHLSVFFLSRG